MKTLIFQVEFKSDIVLPATSNTEGNIVQLDFIPGSNFLGMVARAYSEFEDSFSVFHGGDVRFGDATLLKDGQETYKIPLSYFSPKEDDNAIYNHHFLEPKDFKELGQVKQKRRGYMTAKGEQADVNYSYAQKSAYDKEHRRSKEGSMYGYTAIETGTQWQFVVKYAPTVSEHDIALIKQNLSGKKRLGKSKSAQYGEIEIALKGSSENVETLYGKGKTILYAKSRLALVDDLGNPTYDLDYLCRESDTNVLYEESQIRTATFTPYNGAMQTKTYERVVIEKGSVIVLENVSEEVLTSLKNGVGVYLSEGFGEVLINPEFLMSKEVSLAGESKKENVHKGKKHIVESFNNTSVQFLVNRHNTQMDNLNLVNNVQKFIEKNKVLYGKINKAQWGTIRSICTSGTAEYRDEIREYISSGKVTWNSRQIETLLQEDQSFEFIKLLSIQMPKIKGDQK